MRLIQFLALACCWVNVVFAATVNAQSCNDFRPITIRLTGNVSTALNGSAIPYAYVSVDGRTNGYADANGAYSVEFYVTGYRVNNYNGSCEYSFSTYANVCVSALGYSNSCRNIYIYSNAESDSYYEQTENRTVYPVNYTTPPSVSEVTTAGSDAISIKFNQYMDASSLNKNNFVLLDKDDKSQPINSVVYSAYYNIATVNTSYPLRDGETYSINIAKSTGGSMLSFLVNGRQYSLGGFQSQQSPSQIYGFGLTSTLTADGKLNWSNGSVWSKSGGAPVVQSGNIFATVNGGWTDLQGNQITVSQYSAENTNGLNLIESGPYSIKVNYTKGYTNLAGDWSDQYNNRIAVKQFGSSLNMAVTGGKSSTGSFTAANKITGFSQVGTVNSANKITWSGGSVWTKSASLVYPSIAGKWVDQKKNTILITQAGASLSFKVNKKKAEPGQFTSATSISGFKLVGTVNTVNKTITWSNGSMWSFVP